jgi:acetyl-CoA carboxylase carboxyl transferase alpha subunit
MVHPEGYRKALRLMKQAEKFRRPIITFIDTPGAYPGIGAEERGQAEAIARNLIEMSRLTVPVIAIILGEAASGGAIGLAVANQVWMLENSIYCILSPEGFASILYKDSTKAPDIVEKMKITADALLELGIVDAVIEEGENGLPQNLVSVCYQLRMKLSSTLKSYKKMKPKTIQKERMERFRKFGDVDYEK